MKYDRVEIRETPQAAQPIFQHAVDTYASEINKTAAVWRSFRDADLGWRPHPRSATVGEIFKHQLLSERRFFTEFLGHAEPGASSVLPAGTGVEEYIARMVELASPRLVWLAGLGERDWLERRPFFDVERERIWIFWRRVLHSAHHRTQLTVYLRLLDWTVPAVYGPTADVSWSGADPTLSVASAESSRKDAKD